MSQLVHLHCHTQYSFLDGVASPTQYADRCYELGYPAMAATEHGHMGSMPDMYLAFKQRGLKSIVGCEIYYNDWEPERRRLHDEGIKYRSQEWRLNYPEQANRMFRNRHLTVICKNEIGVRNLIKLTTQAYETGLFGLGRTQYNRVWFDKLCEHKEGLIILSGCLNGPVAHELRFKKLEDKAGNTTFERGKKERLADAAKEIKKFKKVFGDDYYMEFQMPGVAEDVMVFRTLAEMSNMFGVKPVITNDCHYMHRKDFKVQTIMMAIAQETTINSPDLFHVNSDEQYMKTREELFERFKNNDYSNGIDDGFFHEACDNTLRIADMCEHLKVDSTPKIPSFANSDDGLVKLIKNRLMKLGLHKITQKFLIDGKEVTYVEQAEIELQRLIEKGFSGYMLITQDLVDYGRSKGGMFVPRGSACGSLICYLLGIGAIDPLKYGLSFDRFLSPSRGGYMLNVKMVD